MLLTEWGSKLSFVPSYWATIVKAAVFTMS
jgi:hypothetical protein